jgi:hypothetical protein
VRTRCGQTIIESRAMGWLKERRALDGTIGYTAVYRDLQGRERSAGTFSSKRAATEACKQAEAGLKLGRVGDPKRGRQRFRDYVEKEWFPNHVIEQSTREGYRYTLDAHILPEFGAMRMIEILPVHVREWIVKLQTEGVRPPTIRTAKVVLDAVMTTALNDQIAYFHAGKGVRTPPVAKKSLRVITAADYEAIYRAFRTTRCAWTAFLRSLKARGLGGVRLVIADAHLGLGQAVRAVFLGAGIQRCRVHFMRNVLAAVPKPNGEMVAALIRTIFAQPTAHAVREQLDTVAVMLGRQFPKVQAMLEGAKDDLLAFTAFPPTHWKKIWSTNPLERLNKEIKRRCDVVGVFPNPPALLRLAGAVLVEQHDEWQVSDRRYLSEASMAALTAIPTKNQALPSTALLTAS